MSNLDIMHRHPDARFWDRIAVRYARKPVPDQTAYETKLAKTDGYLNSKDLVLEIGCGTGTTALHHAPKVARMLGTDIAPRMIEIARARAREAGNRNAAFEVSSIDDLADTREAYDVILAHSILHLVEDVPRTLRQLHRMLKPGGLMISNTHCIGDSAAWLGRIAPAGRVLGVLPRVNVFREKRFIQWIDEAGFETMETWQPKPRASIYLVARRTGAGA
jgi:2-polyprenyl-3-methyl-5-hydroxy-6-metoxy-1,4-benzoquinol methylase